MSFYDPDGLVLGYQTTHRISADNKARLLAAGFSEAVLWEVNACIKHGADELRSSLATLNKSKAAGVIKKLLDGLDDVTADEDLHKLIDKGIAEIDGGDGWAICEIRKSLLAAQAALEASKHQKVSDTSFLAKALVAVWRANASQPIWTDGSLLPKHEKRDRLTPDVTVSADKMTASPLVILAAVLLSEIYEKNFSYEEVEKKARDALRKVKGEILRYA